MSRILLIGNKPPQFDATARVEAAHYRTWQFLQPLLEDGHAVCLCVEDAAPSPNGSGPQQASEPWRERLSYHPIAFNRAGWISRLQRIHDAFAPDVVVAVNFAPCLYATRLRTTRPVWMDIYGDYLTIMQLAAYRRQSNRGLPTSIAFMQQVLQRGDVFSACGAPQAHMTVGELAMAGRLNWRTTGYEFVRIVLPGAPTTDVALPSPASPRERPALAEAGVQADDFVVLWCGGYNTWTDVDTLFAALESVMARDPRVRFVSIGASAYSAPQTQYQRFESMIERSAHRARYHLLGWRPWGQIAGYYRDSDVGLNVDAMHYETVYGTRTRLLEMMSAGLPVITTEGCELSYRLRDHGAGLSFAAGDNHALAGHILSLSRDPERRDQLARRALECARADLSFAETTRPVRDWVKSPSLAPDRAASGAQHRITQATHRARAAARQMIWQLTGLDR